jgi:hypothetical protein
VGKSWAPRQEMRSTPNKQEIDPKRSVVRISAMPHFLFNLAGPQIKNKQKISDVNKEKEQCVYIIPTCLMVS